MDRVRIQSVEALPGYRLRLGLSDGRSIERDFAAELAVPIGPMDAPLQDPDYFAQVRVDPELETVVWPNGYDMDPDVLIWGLDADGNLLAPPEHAEGTGLTCRTCQTGRTVRGTATKTLEQGEILVVVRHVPADVCDRCGTPLYTGAVVEQLLAWLDEAARAGVTFQVREFTPVAP